MDTWWQTETGGFMITPLPITPLKPGSATKPFFGNEMDVVDESGKSVKTGDEGNLVIKNPWPGMARTILKDPDRFIEKYWKAYEKQGWYLTGDSAKIDKDGYFWIIGRNDDVLKVSGYRLGSAEIESALVSHPAVTEAAAIGLPDQLRGNIIHASCHPGHGLFRFRGAGRRIEEDMSSRKLVPLPNLNSSSSRNPCPRPGVERS